MKAEDALYGFVSWLTTRDEKLILSRSDGSAPAGEALKAFFDANGLGDPSTEYPKSFKMLGDGDEV